MRLTVPILSFTTKDVRRLLVARFISYAGDRAVPIALAFAVLPVYGTEGVGAVVAASAIPPVILFLMGGAVGDRYPRQRVMLVAHGGSFIAQLSIVACVVLGIPSLPTLLACAAIRSAAGAFFSPASTGAVAVSAPVESWQDVMALFSTVTTGAEILGPALAGIMMAFVSPLFVLSLDAVTFLVAGFLIARCGSLGKGRAEGSFAQVFRDIGEGVRYVTGQSWLLTVILASMGFQLAVISSIEVLGPGIAHANWDGATSWAMLSAALGAGGLVGGGIALRYRPTYPLRAGFLLLFLAACPPLALLAINAPFWLMIPVQFVAGMCMALFGVFENTSIVDRVPGEMISRVDATNRGGSMLLRPIGAAGIAPLAAALGMGMTLMGAAGIAFVAVLSPLAISSIRSFRRASS